MVSVAERRRKMDVDFNERELLIQKLKHLIEANEIKQREYQQQNNVSPECGCITKEACMMASLLPQMQKLGVTFDDCR